MDNIELNVTGIIRETHDTVSVFFEPVGNKKIVYEAGQFITFIFNHHGEEFRRSYSFSSTPLIDNFFSITVKRILNGEISRFFTDKLKVDNKLIALQPAGRFTISTNKNSSRQIFFIAAGSGIVPVFSLLKKILHDEPKTHVVLIYQNHHEEDIIFHKQLREILKSHTQFSLVNLLSKPAKNKNPEKLNIFLLEKLIADKFNTDKNTLFYLCGPGSFMRMAQFTLKWMGFTDEQIKKENFTVDFIPLPPLIADTSPKKITIHFQKKTFHIQSAYPKNILQAALDNNIQLPYSCRGGVCSTCVAKCKKGKVRMSNNEVLTEKDMQNGLVLTCVGYAETDLELEF
ncbi:MAG TPA: iron-sulfur cluster-binding domain-containing protein [Puia sp.]|jgi:ring-1,2-phenylacetyl-CoA epoxidase subunit PaaE|nr:iron-sulfur cluster-binding domain-containing protein [Puia sp.]